MPKTKNWTMKVEPNIDLSVFSTVGFVTYVSNACGLCKVVCLTTSATKENLEKITGVLSVAIESRV